MAATKWQPKFDLDTGLEKTIKWLKDNSSEKMGEYLSLIHISEPTRLR